jgi:hypothetical protein
MLSPDRDAFGNTYSSLCNEDHDRCDICGQEVEYDDEGGQHCPTRGCRRHHLYAPPVSATTVPLNDEVYFIDDETPF